MFERAEASEEIRGSFFSSLNNAFNAKWIKW